MQLVAKTQEIPHVLDALRNEPRPDHILTVYLDTSPEQVIGQAYLLSFRSRCQGVRAGLEGEERNSFDAAAERVETYLTNRMPSTHAGVAIFTGPSEDYFFAVTLPEGAKDQVERDVRPHIDPLQRATDEYERIAVLLFDKEHARIFTVYLGEVEERLAFEDDVPGKQATGGWFGLAQSRYARHHEEHVLRHVKRAADDLLVLLRSRPFDRLLLAGPDEALALLRDHLPRHLVTRLAGTLSLEMFASDEDVLRAALARAEQLERLGEIAAIDELAEGASSKFGALGFEPTLEALNETRVHTLFVAGDFGAPGAECEMCHRLSRPFPVCPICGSPATQLLELRERIVEVALDQGAKVETVFGKAAERLAGYGGLGAWTRY